MKVFITTKPQEAPKNYLVLSPLVSEGAKHVDTDTICVDQYAENGEVEELVLNEILGYVAPGQFSAIVANLAKKLKHGGIIIINGVDAYIIAKLFIEDNLSIDNLNLLVHGDDPNLPRRMSITLQDVSKLLTSLGLKIMRRRIDSFRYSIKAQRP